MDGTATMDLTTFRADLTQIVDRLEKTGPLRLTKYNDSVAEIRSATREGDRQYARSILDVFWYFEDLNQGLTGVLTRTGIDTLAAFAELARRHKELEAEGVTFDRYPEHCLPDQGSLTVDETLARLYFGDDYPEGTEDPYAWFLACAQIQKEAKKRGLGTKLPQPNAYDEAQPTFVEVVVASGHNPETLVAFAVQAFDQGVKPERLADMLGNEPVPADVVSLPGYSDSVFEELTRNGLSHAEAIDVFRKGLDLGDACGLASAGILNAKEIERLLGEKISVELVLRAARDGLTPEEWKVQVPKIQHLKYRGIQRQFGAQEPGMLPFRLLVQAAEEKVSLVRWDSNSLRVRADQTNRHFYAKADQRQTMYPWVFVYPDRVLDLARARVAPSYVTAFGKLMEHHFNDGTAPEGFADLAIRTHELGLTAAMADAMSRSDAKRPKFTPAQLIAVLEGGLADVGTAHYLAGQYAEPDAWLDHLWQRRERQLMTDTFVATVENTPAWGAVRSAVLAIQGLIKSRVLQGEIYLRGVVEKTLADEALNDYEVLTLLNTVAWAFGDRSYLPKAWLKEHEGQADEVRQLAKNFDAMCRAGVIRG